MSDAADFPPLYDQDWSAPMKRDERGKYNIVRKEYPSGQPYFIFEYLEGDQVSPLTNRNFRIELKTGINFDEVKKFEEWLNRNIAAIASTPAEPRG